MLKTQPERYTIKLLLKVQIHRITLRVKQLRVVFYVYTLL